MSLATRVLLGFGLGVAVGLFFGEGVAFLEIGGQAFTLLLQMAVLPYVAVSLVAGLGGLTFEQAATLAKRAGAFLLILWALAFSVILLIPLAFPAWESASFFSTTLVQEDAPFDFLSLFIPANPFSALSNNVVPAVVVFSVALGLALIGIDRQRKEGLLQILSTLVQALGEITSFVVRLAPYGVFAIAAQAAGTMQLEQFKGLQVYVATYGSCVLLLTFWTVPTFVTALTPFRYREVVGMTRDALVTAFATGNVFVVLSVLSEKAKKLLVTREGEEAEALVDVVVPASFNFPSMGKLMGLSFVPFAGWLSGFALSAAAYPVFVVTGLFTYFGASVAAIPFLLDTFHIPSDTFQLFLISENVVGNRFGALLAAMHILALALLSACSVGGLIRVRPAKLARWAVLTILFTGATLGAVRLTFESIGHEYLKYREFMSMEPLREGVPTRVLDRPASPLPTVDTTVPLLDRIRERGVLRVAYLADRLPYAFKNESGSLVGLDVELANELARELRIDLEFVRIDSVSQLAQLLNAGYLDLGMSILVTPDHMKGMALSAPYVEDTMAFVVADHRREKFATGDSVRRMGELKIAIPNSRYYIEKMQRSFPEAELHVVDSPRPFFRQDEDYDALIFGAQAGSAWTLVYPQYSVAVPRPDILALPLGFAVARGEQEMVNLLDAWIELKKRDRTMDDLFRYWIQGNSPVKAKPRWSVIRDVLGWVE